VAGCPRCGKEIATTAGVCRHCLFVLDEDAHRQRDAGRLGADARGGGRELEDPAVGPLPLAGSGLTGIANAALRLVPTGLLVRRRRRGHSDM
jgi:hypothetical protein